MSRNEEDVDLRLALGYSSGASANADSRVDMPFAASVPLSELVWSPHNGLSLKCANRSLADKKPLLKWDIGECTKESLASQDIRLDKVSAGEELSVSKTMLSGGIEGLIEKAIDADAIQPEKHREEDLSTSQNVQIADIAESSKRNAETDIRADASRLIRGTRFNRKGRLEKHASRSGIMGLAVPIRSAPPTAKASEAPVCSLPNLQAPQQIDDEATSASADVNKTKTDAALSVHALALMKLESSAENDLPHLVAREDSSLPVERAPTNSRICLYREKGKEKALSDGGLYGRSSNEKDDIHESMESCNSAGLLPKGIKRQYFDRGDAVGCKRVKKCIEGPTSVIRAQSSFMNWISNIVKVLPESNKQESPLLGLALARPNNYRSNTHQESLDSAKPTGFQNVFQSFYCQTNKAYISGAEKDTRLIADCNRNNDGSSKQIILSDQEVNPHISRSSIQPWMFSADYANGNSSEAENKALEIAECSRAIIEGNSSTSLCKKEMNLDVPLPMSTCAPEKSNPLSSLWVTRLYTKTAKLENCIRISEDAIDCSSAFPKESQANDVYSTGQKISEARDDYAGYKINALEGEMQRLSPKESFDFKSSHKKSLIQPSHELRSSEAMASVFAKRLDALRHIIHPLESRNPQAFALTCFFCGNSGHDIRKCPELTETELDNILLHISSFDRLDESSSLCIRCFQLDHWAISCPFASSQSKQNGSAVKQQTTFRANADDDKCSSYLGGVEEQHTRKPILGSFPSFLARNMKESSSRRFYTSNELQRKSTLSDFQNHMSVPHEEMFCAIRKLRLSRADILRWMSSDVSLLHLNGFFLRLRLGKLEGGQERTGYYVACIKGDSTENIGCKSEKSVLVDVGGIKSSVGSRYISNHDFLEEEIKDWWTRIEKSGGKIPCLDELKLRFEDRKTLGL